MSSTVGPVINCKGNFYFTPWTSAFLVTIEPFHSSTERQSYLIIWTETQGERKRWWQEQPSQNAADERLSVWPPSVVRWEWVESCSEHQSMSKKVQPPLKLGFIDEMTSAPVASQAPLSWVSVTSSTLVLSAKLSILTHLQPGPARATVTQQSKERGRQEFCLTFSYSIAIIQE